jgi:hypothetical protein
MALRPPQEPLRGLLEKITPTARPAITSASKIKAAINVSIKILIKE